MRCMACDIIMSQKDLNLDDEFCSKCYKSYLDNLDDISRDISDEN